MVEKRRSGTVRMTLNQFVKRYGDKIPQIQKGPQRVIVKSAILPVLGRKHLTSIDDKTRARFFKDRLASLRKDGKRRTETSVRWEIDTLSMLLERAEDFGVLKTS